MSRTDDEVQIRLNRAMLHYIWRQLRKRWWWIGLGVLAGCVLGLALALRAGLWYRSKVAFVTTRESTRVEEERLGGRNLLLGACDRLSNVRIDCFVDKGFRGKWNMYNQSPFQALIPSIPLHMMDQELRLKFKDAQTYTLFDAQDQVIFEGRVGQQMRKGGLKLLILPTDGWIASSIDHEYYIRYNSDNALVESLRENIEIYTDLASPERIEVTYKDHHPQRALDIVEAFTEAYRHETQLAVDVQVKKRIQQIDLEYKVAQAAMQAQPAYWNLRNGLLQSDDAQSADSLLMAIQQKYQYMQVLDSHRLQLKNWRQNGYDTLLLTQLPPLDWDKELRVSYEAWLKATRQNAFGNEQGDRRQELSLRVDETIRKDSMALKAEQGKLMEMEAGYQLMGDAFDLKIKAAAVQTSGGNEIEAAWNQMRKLEEERYTLQKSIWDRTTNVYITDSPYLVPGSPRAEQYRVGLSGIVFGGMIGLIAWVFGLTRGGRFRMEELIGKLPKHIVVHRIPDPDSAGTALRHFATQAMLKAFPKGSIITVTGTNECPELFRAWLDFLQAANWKFALLGQDQPEIQGLPSFNSPSAWLDPAQKPLLDQASNSHDLVLLCLPTLNEVPEALNGLLMAHGSVMFIGRGSRVGAFEHWYKQVPANQTHFCVWQTAAK